MKPKYLLSLLFLVAIMAACKKDAPSDFDYGKVENGKYVNPFFELEVPLPVGWIVQTKEQMENLTTEGSDLVAGDDKKMRAIIKAADVNIANLLGVSQYEKGSPVTFNPSIIIVAENVKNSPGIKSGSDYLFNSRKLLLQSQFKYDHMDSTFAKVNISGADFYKMNADVTYAGVKIMQDYYSTISKNFALNVIISYSNDDQKQELEKFIHAITLNN